MGLSSVFNNINAVFFCNLINLLHVTDISINMDRNYGFCTLCYFFLNAFSVNAQSIFFYVGKNRLCIGESSGICSAGESKRRDNDLVALFYVQRAKRKMQSNSPVKARRCILCAAVRAEKILKSFN